MMLVWSCQDEDYTEERAGDDAGVVTVHEISPGGIVPLYRRQICHQYKSSGCSEVISSETERRGKLRPADACSGLGMVDSFSSGRAESCDCSDGLFEIH